jgi:hypothetical protein
MTVGLGHQLGKYPLIVSKRHGVVGPNHDNQIISAWKIVPKEADGFA